MLHLCTDFANLLFESKLGLLGFVGLVGGGVDCRMD